MGSMKRVQLAALFLVAAALLALRASSGYAMLLPVMLSLGFGGGAIVNGANGLPPAIKFESLSTAGVFNLLNLFFGLGGLVTPLFAAKLFKNNTSRLLVFAAVLTGLTLCICAITAMPAPSGQVSFQVSAVGTLLSRPALWLLSLMLFLYISCEVGVWNWLVRHLVAQGLEQGKALTILSLGFALGLLLGRVAVSPILTGVRAETVLLASSVLMAVTTYAMLHARGAGIAQGAVFLAGVAMAPVFPTTLAIVNANPAFSGMTATATGIALVFGWFGLVVSSPIIGHIAGDDPKRLKTALLVLPVFSVIMLLVSFAL